MKYGFALVLIYQEAKYLLIQEAKEEARGLWNFPAGRPEIGETIEQTAIRETKEETGFDIELINSLGEWESSVSPGTYRKLFTAKVLSGELKPQTEDVLDARWFTKEEIYEMKDYIRDELVFEGIRIIENNNEVSN